MEKDQGLAAVLVTGDEVLVGRARWLAGSARTWTESVIRFFGTDERELNATLKDARRRLPLDSFDMNLCFPEEGPGELALVVVFPESQTSTYDALLARVLDRHRSEVFSTDGRTVDEIVSERIAGRRVAVVDAAHGRMVALLRDRGTWASGIILDPADQDQLMDLGGVPSYMAVRGDGGWIAECLASNGLLTFGADFALALFSRDPTTAHLCAVSPAVPRLMRTVRLSQGGAALEELAATWLLHMLLELLEREAPR